MKIIGIAEKDGGLYNENGLNIEELAKFIDDLPKTKKSLKDFPNSKFIEDSEVIYQPCDIFIPAYKEGQITTFYIIIKSKC